MYGGGLTKTELQTSELIAVLSPDLRRDEAIRRATEVPTIIGAAAIHGAENEFKVEVSSFLNSRVKIDTTKQLSIMRKFWHRLEHNMPKLSDSQQDTLIRTSRDHPSRRIVPAPLLSLAGRQAFAINARTFFNQNRFEGLDADCVHGQLLEESENNAKGESNSYGLRYKTPSGEVVGRKSYIAALKESGQSVEAEDGINWVFPIMDVGVRSKRSNRHAHQLHRLVNPIVTPEVLIATRILHKAGDTASRKCETDIANEVIYELDKDGNIATLIRVIGVDWDPTYHQVDLDSISATDKSGYFGIRHAVSGL
ncbi:hypothetical protein H7X68_03685 [Candidatus Saccharibacteria bacterium]|nr:hypothetical protein [Candidatus Saccharibacteria bacterium]